VFQDGVELVADVTQGGGTGNLSIIEQTGDLYDAEVVQDGDSNVSTITQTPPDDVTFTSSSVFVEQLGDENFSEVTQSGDLSQNVEVYQDGFKNSSTVSQGQAFGISALNDVIVEQLGELNESTVTQGNLEESDLNVAEVSQDGLRNVSEITQNSGPIFFGNSADVEQFADDGFSSITQSGDDNLAVVRQYSDGNTSFVMQNNTANTAFVNQGEGPLPIPDMPLPQ